MMKRIVIIEDHPVLIRIYRNKFTAGGFQVEMATDGQSGLDLIYRIKPDLVVLDLAMPKLNGIQVLKSLRANPSFKALPVIIFSDSAWKEQAWKEGATVVLSKSHHSPNQVVEAARNSLGMFESQEIDAMYNTNIAFLATTQPSSGEAARPAPTQAQVLLVEDHPDMKNVIFSSLDRAGFDVTVVASHAAALQHARTQDFAAYLVNRLCPDGIGLSLCRQLRKMDPHKTIVMYSTMSLPITQEQRLQAGASIYLTQPADILNPAETLSKLINEAKTLEQSVFLLADEQFSQGSFQNCHEK